MKRKEAERMLKVSLESEKNERKRIAADLHDSVSSDLSAIRNYLVVLLKGETDEGKQSVLQDLKNGVEVAIENTRQVSYKLMPPLLDKLGFVLALEDYMCNLSKSSGVSFSMHCRDEKFDLDSTSSYELFRVVQELTTNMLKYGGITKCQIILYTIEFTAYVEIIDDGIPFDFQKELLTATGAGLLNISSRLNAIRAALLQRTVVEGNHFVISLPL